MRFTNITDVNGFGLPAFQFKTEDIPPQIGSELEAQLIEAAGPPAVYAIAGIIGTNFAVNSAYSGSFT